MPQQSDALPPNGEVQIQGRHIDSSEHGAQHEVQYVPGDFLNHNHLYPTVRRTIDTVDGQLPIITFVPQYLLPSQSLSELAECSTPGVRDGASGIMQGETRATRTPLSDLTCAQARILVAHRIGLKWLAAPIAAFVTRYPSAQCGLFDGDLSLNAIFAWQALLRFAPRETIQMLRSDFAPILIGSLGREASSIIRRAHIELGAAPASLARDETIQPQWY